MLRRLVQSQGVAEQRTAIAHSVQHLGCVLLIDLLSRHSVSLLVEKLVSGLQCQSGADAENDEAQGCTPASLVSGFLGLDEDHT